MKAGVARWSAWKLAGWGAVALARVAAAEPPAIDTDGFGDSTHHWRNINQPERIMQALPQQPSYAPAQVREIAANVLLFQRENGGWPKDYDMLAVLTEEQKKLIRDTRKPTLIAETHIWHLANSSLPSRTMTKP